MQTSEINIFKEQERMPPMHICECHKTLPLMAKREGDDIVLRRYRACRSCMDYEIAKSEGWDWPTCHPKMPIIFRDTDENKLHPRMKDALSWKPTAQKSGMLLHGTTGIGKSRAAWEWVNRKWLEGVKRNLNLNFLFLTMSELEEKIQDSFSDKKHGETLKMLCENSLLVLDDFGKERLTPRMATDIFALIDKRTLQSKTTIITTNFNSKSLIERFGPQDKETGVALIRRLKDYYTPYGMQELHHENK